MIEEDLDESAYKVSLPSFKGPLDLLLHLIKQNEIDIYDIPIALITDQFNSYLMEMEELDLEVAADYIYMAALYAKLKERSPIQLQWFIEGRDRDELIATFLGVLELGRMGGISLQQGELFGDILIAITQNPLDEAQFAIYDQR